MDIEQFKAVNTFQCARLKADAITPEACAANRKKLPLNKGIPGTHPNPMPFACEECMDWKRLCEQVYEKRLQAGIKKNRPAPAKAPAESGGVCAHCKTTYSKPAARGLCWNCYSSLRNHGGLEAYPMSINYHRRKKAHKESVGES